MENSAPGPDKSALPVAKIALAAGLVGISLWLGCNPQIYKEALVSAFFSFALGSVVIIHLRVRPSWQDAFLIVGGSFLLALIDFKLLHFQPAVLAWLSFAGLSSLAILGARAALADGDARRLLLLAFVPAVLFVGSEYFAGDMLEWTAARHPAVYDLYLYSFDSSLHLQLPFLVGQWFAASTLLRNVSLFFYLGLPVTIALIYAGRVLRVREAAVPSFLAFLLTGPLGICFYNLLPALGPAHLFPGKFPIPPLAISQVARLFVEPISLAGPPNAIPSLHMAWVLLAFWYSRGLSLWERAAALAFVIFTILATMGTGEHYFIDLIVALPFAVFVEALFSFSLGWRNPCRLAAGFFGLVAILAWLIALRSANHFFWMSPVLPWTLCTLTVAASLWLERRLYAPPVAITQPASVPIPVEAS